MYLDINWSVLQDYKGLFIEGFFTTIEVTSISILFGLMIGLVIGIMRVSDNKLPLIIAKIYIDIFRGTPLLLQILAIHGAILPFLFVEVFKFSSPPSALVSGLVALSLNSAAYISEIFRSGICSIDKGQMEAGRSLGLTYGQAMRYIIIPQAFKRVLPPLGNEFIALLKDSSLIMVIAVHEITYAASSAAKSTFERLPPYILAACIYLVLTIILSRGVLYMERRMEN